MPEQSLNSLDRFRKRSERLMLEEQSACEAPAGCGGVVLRWRNPVESRPLRILLFCSAEAVLWIDGVVWGNGRIDLRPGQHVLGIEIGETDRTAGLLMAVLRHDPLLRPREGVGPVVHEPPLCILSADDGSWRFSLERPPEGWASPDFDGRWEALVDRPIPEVPWSAPNAYQWHTCHEQKAAGLGVPHSEGVAPRGPVWVIRAFEVPPPLAP